MKTHPLILPLVLVAGSLSWSSLSAEKFREVLTDTATNTWVETFAIGEGQAKTGKGDTWGVKKYTLRGGKQDGVDVIEINNGKMTFSVIPTRGMNVYKVECGDVTLGWNSPVKEIVNPAFINPADRGGLGWLDGFNEWMARCGYEFAGHPGEDGDQLLTLHGKASNLPASKVEVFMDDDGRIHVQGRVEESMFKFAQLEMVTDISTELGSSTIRFDDTLTNRGSNEQEFEVIYHSNYGEPLLEKGSKFVGPIAIVTPFDARAAEEMKDYPVYYGPTKGYGETVYCMTLNAGSDGNTITMLHNQAGDRGVSLTYGMSSLPYFTLWKNTDVGEKGYVTGLEPATGYPYNRAVERERGRVKKLAAGASRKFQIEVEVLMDAAAVKRTADAIGKIQGGRETKVVPDPES